MENFITYRNAQYLQTQRNPEVCATKPKNQKQCFAPGYPLSKAEHLDPLGRQQGS